MRVLVFLIVFGIIENVNGFRRSFRSGRLTRAVDDADDLLAYRPSFLQSAAAGATEPAGDPPVSAMPGYGQYVSCKDGDETCQWDRYLLQQNVNANNTAFTTSWLGPPNTAVSTALAGNKQLTTGISNVTNGINNPLELNGATAMLTNVKTASAMILKLIQDLVHTAQANMNTAANGDTALLNAAATDFGNRLQAYQATVQNSIQKLDLEMAQATASQKAAFGLQAKQAGMAANSSLNSVANAVAAANGTISATSTNINSAVSSVNSNADAARMAANAAIGAAANGAQAASQTGQATVTVSQEAAISGVSSTANAAVGNNQAAAARYAAGVSSSLKGEDSVMAGLVQSYNSASTAGYSNYKAAVSVALDDATDLLSSATASNEGAAAAVASGAQAVLNDVENTISDQNGMAAAQSAEYSELSTSAQTSTGTLATAAQQMFADAEGKMRNSIQSAEQDANKEIQRQNGNLANVNAVTAATLQSLVSAALASANGAAIAQGQSSADVNSQISSASTAIATGTAALNGQAVTAVQELLNKLAGSTGNTESAANDLMAMLAQLIAASGQKISSTQEAVDAAMAAAKSQAAQEMVDASNANAAAMSGVTGQLGDRVGGLQGTLSDAADVLSDLLDSADAGQAQAEQALASLAANGKGSQDALAAFARQFNGLSTSSGSAVDSEKGAAKTQIGDVMGAVNAFQSNVANGLNNAIGAQIGGINSGNANTNDALTSSAAGANAMLLAVSNLMTSAAAQKAQIAASFSSYAQNAEAAAMGIATHSGDSDAEFVRGLQRNFGAHEMAVENWLNGYLQQSLNVSGNATHAVAQTTMIGLAGLTAFVNQVLNQSLSAKDIVNRALSGVSFDGQNLASEISTVNAFFHSSNDNVNKELDDTYDAIQAAWGAKNTSIQATFEGLKETAKKVSQQTAQAGLALYKNVAGQQLQIEDFINQLKQAMNLAELQDQRNQQAEMAAELAKLNSSQNAMTENAASMNSSIANEAQSSSRTTKRLEGAVDSVSAAADATNGDSQETASATTNSLLAAGEAAHEGFLTIENTANASANAYNNALVSGATATLTALDRTEGAASADVNNLAADATSTAQVWERSMQDSLYTVSQNMDDMEALFENLGAMNASVIENIASMLESINNAFGFSIGQSASSSAETVNRFARVQDVVSVFGQVIEQFLNETTDSMSTIRANSKSLSVLVNEKIGDMEQRVIDQTRWIGTGINATSNQQFAALSQVLAMQDELKSRVSSLSTNIQSMQTGLTNNINELDDTISYASNDIDSWSTNVTLSLQNWINSAEAETAASIISDHRA